jgi:hypothetical protein
VDPGHVCPPAARGLRSSQRLLVLTPLLTPLSTGTPGQVRVTAHQRAPPAPAGGPAGRRGRRVQSPPQRPRPFWLLGVAAGSRRPPRPHDARVPRLASLRLECRLDTEVLSSKRLGPPGPGHRDWHLLPREKRPAMATAHQDKHGQNGGRGLTSGTMRATGADGHWSHGILGGCTLRRPR